MRVLSGALLVVLGVQLELTVFSAKFDAVSLEQFLKIIENVLFLLTADLDFLDFLGQLGQPEGRVRVLLFARGRQLDALVADIRRVDVRLRVSQTSLPVDGFVCQLLSTTSALGPLRSSPGLDFLLGVMGPLARCA